MGTEMRADDEAGEHLVLDRVHHILDHTEHVKTAQNGLSQFHVLVERQRWDVALVGQSLSAQK